MATARVYTDEDVHAAVALGLRLRGFDVLTTLDAGRAGTSDESQLDFAAVHVAGEGASRVVAEHGAATRDARRDRARATLSLPLGSA